MVVEAVRPHRTDGHGESWRLLAANHDQIAEWVTADLTAVKIHELLGRRGVMVPCRTVQRYVFEVCVRSRGRGPTVRVADGEPGDELPVSRVQSQLFGQVTPAPTTALRPPACFNAPAACPLTATGPDREPGPGSGGTGRVPGWSWSRSSTGTGCSQRCSRQWPRADTESHHFRWLARPQGVNVRPIRGQ